MGVVGDLGFVSESAVSFTVLLTLTVGDARALWTAAADRALEAPGMTLADVLDTIGPREDPSIADCIAMLTGPVAVAGCTLDTFEIGEQRATPLPAQVVQLPALRVARA